MKSGSVITKDHFLNIPGLIIDVQPYSSVGRVQDLRIGDRWFDRRIGHYSYNVSKRLLTSGSLKFGIVIGFMSSV